MWRYVSRVCVVQCSEENREVVREGDRVVVMIQSSVLRGDKKNKERKTTKEKERSTHSTDVFIARIESGSCLEICITRGSTTPCWAASRVSAIETRAKYRLPLRDILARTHQRRTSSMVGASMDWKSGTLARYSNFTHIGEDLPAEGDWFRLRRGSTVSSTTTSSTTSTIIGSSFPS